jgi:3-oxoacyl-[acyl-carrier protein] reductase
MIAAKKRGVLINISSICASGNPGQAAYSAAKAGLNGLSMALAKELGPFGIRVVSLAPGFIDTPSTQNAISAELLGRVRKNTPLKRLGTPEEIVSAVRFILENEYFTGRTLQIDGGLTI